MGKENWSRIAFYYHLIFLEHLHGVRHPENPERLELIKDYLIEKGVWDSMQVKTPQPADIKWIEATHSSEYVRFVKAACEKAPQILDGGDTVVTTKSHEAALYAAGACIMGVDDLLNNQAHAVFCAVRPPGHHAEFAHAMGFCLFNNVAIAARYALRNYGLKRIFILDWDVHHGNGTHNTFEYSNEVFFCSIHQSRLYPGSGDSSETGKGDGEGFTLNFPLPAGSGDKDYLSLLNKKIIPELHKFNPELLIISAGFDAHDEDPLASMKLSTECYGEMTKLLHSAMQEHNGGKILSVLEGGYHLSHLAESVFTHLQAFVRE
jgi:acetoin utilization deacetylase AcuC-like enzyme